MDTRNKQTVRVGRDAESLASLERQHEVMDTEVRSTDGIDYIQVKREADELINLRKSGMSSSDLSARATQDYAYFSNKFPQFVKSIVKDCEVRRLDEFTQVMHKLLDGLDNVQKGCLSQTALRQSLFERELANKYLRPK